MIDWNEYEIVDADGPIIDIVGPVSTHRCDACGEKELPIYLLKPEESNSTFPICSGCLEQDANDPASPDTYRLKD